MKKEFYQMPTIEQTEYLCEQGFMVSDQQQYPSDWEDM